MEDLAAVVFLMAVAPGALVGLICGLRHGAVSALLYALAGAVGGFGGATVLGNLVERLGLQGDVLSPLSVVGGSALGALVLLQIVGLLRKAATG